MKKSSVSDARTNVRGHKARKCNVRIFAPNRFPVIVPVLGRVYIIVVFERDFIPVPLYANQSLCCWYDECEPIHSETQNSYFHPRCHFTL